MEADPQSSHIAKYSYTTTDEEAAKNIVKMHRTVQSKDVIDYTSHIPGEDVALDKQEDVEYKKGVLIRAAGTIHIKLMPEEAVPPEYDIKSDNLEAERRRRAARENDPETYDSTVKINRMAAKGSYDVELVGQQRILRHTRSIADHLQLPEAVESSLLAFVNQTQRDLKHMRKLRSQLGDIVPVLEALHRNVNSTETVQILRQLLQLEAKYGPLPAYTPAINDVIEYLRQLLNSSNKRDSDMRSLIYSTISVEGSLPSQMALLESLKNAVDEEELYTVITYIALVANPQPQLVSQLEDLIGSDVHSDDPLLLAYGAIVSRAPPEIQQRMTLFLLERLPQSESDSFSLIHHILALGNTGSAHVSNSLMNYVQHDDEDIQLTAILAMRFLMNEAPIQKLLTGILNQPEVSESHIFAVIKSLLYGIEHAKNNYQKKPYSHELATALVFSAISIDSAELHSAIKQYLRSINSEKALNLVDQLSTGHATEYYNGTRFRRGTNWAEENDTYDLVQSLSERQADLQNYTHNVAYIWGKKLGVSDLNAQFAAGAFAGVTNNGSYKLFGHAIAKATAFGRTATIVDTLIQRKKEPEFTQSQIYVYILGFILVNVNESQNSSVCKIISREIYGGRQFLIFDFGHSVFINVGFLHFGVSATGRLSIDAYIEFCDNYGNVSAAVGFSPTLTLTATASAEVEIAFLIKGGVSLSAILNYQLLPEFSSTFCYTDGQIRVKNCIGIDHQLTNNKIELNVWYAFRGWCGWTPCFGVDAFRNKTKIDALSTSWSLPIQYRWSLYETCDSDIQC